MPSLFFDFHHSGTMHALQLLFVKRLGYTLFAPLGLEWLEQGLWKAYPTEADQQKFLDPPNQRVGQSGFTYAFDEHEGIEQAYLTLEEFRSVPIDVVICTHPHHEVIYHRLAKEKKAKFIRWLGNPGEYIQASRSRNVIDTTGLYARGVPSWCNYIHIFQEFPLDVFYPEPPTGEQIVRQYLHFPHKQTYYPIWQEFKRRLPEARWVEHGMEGDDGLVTPISELAHVMRDSAFTWHMKFWDGFGLIAHNSMAVGRPLITRGVFWSDKTLSPLLIDGQTYIETEWGNMEAKARKIKRYLQPEEQLRMYEATRKRFKEVVDYAETAERVEEFMGRLQG